MALSVGQPTKLISTGRKTKSFLAPSESQLVLGFVELVAVLQSMNRLCALLNPKTICVTAKLLRNTANLAKRFGGNGLELRRPGFSSAFRGETHRDVCEIVGSCLHSFWKLDA